jgi:soluble lytic murein transglycosylase-like protein
MPCGSTSASCRRVPPKPLLRLALLAVFLPAAVWAQAVAPAAPPGAADPRIEIAELRLKGTADAGSDPAAAQLLLEVVARLQRERPAEAKAAGFDYLRARLLAQSGQKAEAILALTDSLNGSPSLSPWARYHLAALHEEAGRPEPAAAQAAAVLGTRPARPLLERSLVVFARSVAAGGDCRLLAGIPPLQWKPKELRYLSFARAECAQRAGRFAEAQQLLVALLEAKVEDDPALLAAEKLAARIDPEKAPGRLLLLVGSSYYEHRDFVAAIPFLNVAIGRLVSGRDLPAGRYWQARYALGRSLFWLERYSEAAMAFDALARSSTTAGERAQAYFQKGRSLELQALDPAQAARREEAAATYGEVLRLLPEGRLFNAASISKSRLDWLAGREGEALVQLEGHLAKKRNEPASQLLAFLIATDLAAGKTVRPATWIPIAERLPKGPKLEIAYWKARMAEIENRRADALELYIRAWQMAPYDPVAQGAWQRLQSENLRSAAEARARQLARSANPGELFFAWRFLGDSAPAGVLARTALKGLLQRDPRAAALLRLEPRPVTAWPLWQLPLRSGEELLAGLGLFDDGPGLAGRLFPTADPGLDLAGSRALAAAGAHHASLYRAESMAKRAPVAMPAALLPPALRERAYPLGYRPLLEREGKEWKIDPQLLAAIVREESRFDPRAFSNASARGLTQFILPTAQQMAAKHKLGPLGPLDLHRPEVSIELGAVYLSELDKTFGGSLPPMVAAYNAGAPQARLWKSYCKSDDPVEYLSKVGFEETRNYLTKVLTSRAHYREIYGPPPVVPENSRVSRPGSSP